MICIMQVLFFFYLYYKPNFLSVTREDKRNSSSFLRECVLFFLFFLSLPFFSVCLFLCPFYTTFTLWFPFPHRNDRRRNRKWHVSPIFTILTITLKKLTKNSSYWTHLAPYTHKQTSISLLNTPPNDIVTNTMATTNAKKNLAEAILGRHSTLEVKSLHLGGLFHAEEEIQMTAAMPNFVGQLQGFVYNGHRWVVCCLIVISNGTCFLQNEYR